MTRDEWQQLASALTNSWHAAGVELPTTPATTDRDGSVQAGTPQRVEDVVRNALRTVTDANARRAENERPTSQKAAATSGEGSSVASEVLKTAGMVTGVGPLVTGLIKLFGGGSDDAPAAAPVKYDLPPALAVSAALRQDRSFSQYSYTQNDKLRMDTDTETDGPSRQAAAASVPAIQIQVNAMDSRSFLDHSDEIAQAVRAAMLRSHALNDVVSEV